MFKLEESTLLAIDEAISGKAISYEADSANGCSTCTNACQRECSGNCGGPRKWDPWIDK